MSTVSRGSSGDRRALGRRKLGHGLVVTALHAVLAFLLPIAARMVFALSLSSGCVWPPGHPGVSHSVLIWDKMMLVPQRRNPFVKSSLVVKSRLHISLASLRGSGKSCYKSVPAN